LVLYLVLIITIWNVFRVWGGVQFQTGIAKYAPWPGPVYVIVTGVIWVVWGLVILAAFLRREHWADKALVSGALAYVAWLWLDRLVVQPRLPANWPFSVVTNSVLLVITTAVALDPRNRDYLGREAHEREEQDRKTA
jgi:hypothetical protein